jgi:hypothetical protein
VGQNCVIESGQWVFIRQSLRLNYSPTIVINRARRSFISALANYLVATSGHAHGPIGDPRTARRSDQECEVRFIDARQGEGPKVASEANISLSTKWH